MPLDDHFPAKKNKNNPPIPKYPPQNLARSKHLGIIDEFTSKYHAPHT
jgi:hypothetical protein